MKAVKLHFRSPLHVGMGSTDSVDVPVHSDTLFGAMGNALSAMGIPLDGLIDAVSSGRARFSSLYPFRGREYYLPKPLHADSLVAKTAMGSRENYRVSKKFKKSKFLPKKVFEDVINRNIDPERIIELLPERMPFKVADVPKVALDRVTSNSSIYYLTQVFFEESAGLYFLYDGDGSVFRKYVLPAVRFLGDEGLGGKRTWGLGLFNVEVKDVEIRESNGDSFVTLSLTLPRSRDELVYWEPVKRSGWVNTKTGTPRRKPTMLFAREGSIVSSKDAGAVIDLDDYGNFSKEIGHKVHVYGKAFPVRVMLK
ncbi:hypothetical protein APY94_04210 [Thermococcus celericrescens]|uniref:CRISPR system Cms protein Csm4 n=1 Tax=Thermococcus celericrescens TaxID=227598 RepID=A0A117ITN8_9EURY|nr:type III-A CRISPR-associated RAMP protein Csm4 [Thermococcus celericrescens]KUH33940.1 hypothetical protein APY94_04210 [Thermococcus celericrescens]